MRPEHPHGSYCLAGKVELQALDTHSARPRFLACVEGRGQFEVNEGVAGVIRVLLTGSRTPEALSRDMMERGFAQATPSRMAELLEKVLIPKGLVRPEGADVPAHAPSSPRPSKRSYLWLKRPLIRGQTLRPLTKRLSVLFRPGALAVVLGLGGVAHGLFYLAVLPSFTWSLSALPLSHFALLMALMTATALFHELGHATACSYHGCPHGPIGWGVYMYMPVLYTDVTAAWRLTRPQRAHVDLGGMYFELMASVVVLVLWLTLHEPLFVYAFVLLDLSLLGSLNPVMRRDGYWLAADLLGQTNLRDANMAMLRAWLSRLLGRPSSAGSGAPLPAPWVRTSLVLYSASTVLFTAGLFYLLGAHVLRDLLPRVPQLLVSLSASVVGAEQSVTGAFDAAVRLLLVAASLLMMGVAAVRFVTFLGRSLRPASPRAEAQERPQEATP